MINQQDQWRRLWEAALPIFFPSELKIKATLSRFISLIMVDHDDLHLSRKTILSPARKIDGSQEHPHLEDNLGFRDRQTASLDSIGSRHGNNQFLFKEYPNNIVEELPVVMQPVPIPLNTDPVMASLLAAIN